MFECDMMSHTEALPTHKLDTAWNPSSGFMNWLLPQCKSYKEEIKGGTDNE